MQFHADLRTKVLDSQSQKLSTQLIISKIPSKLADDTKAILVAWLIPAEICQLKAWLRAHPRS